MEIIEPTNMTYILDLEIKGLHDRPANRMKIPQGLQINGPANKIDHGRENVIGLQINE